MYMLPLVYLYLYFSLLSCTFFCFTTYARQKLLASFFDRTLLIMVESGLKSRSGLLITLWTKVSHHTLIIVIKSHNNCANDSRKTYGIYLFWHSLYSTCISSLSVLTTSSSLLITPPFTTYDTTSNVCYDNEVISRWPSMATYSIV